ncbi:MAG: aminotransferase class III-fold pyridoxal phosphate-dependent enzyme, partial [Candidatus Rokuibacteriota bacterium]
MDTKTLFEWSGTYHMPNFARTPIVLVRGDGLRVWDTEGREYLDFGAGLAVTALGHSHPRVTGAIREAAATLLHVSNLYHNVPQIHLAKLLCEHSFADQAYFSNSGAEANEAAIKIARKYGKERFATDRYEIIATHDSFHGRTLATVTATGQPKYHHGFEPLVPGFKHVPYNDLRS